MYEYDAYAVIGANYGDEGKGVVTNTLVLQSYYHDRNPMIVLHNGGPQRGHTVHYNILNEKGYHTFRHRGSAITGVALNTPTYFADTFLVNPMVFMEETNDLIKKKFIALRTQSRIYVHDNCRVITPVDMLLNQLESGIRGTHITCGQGIWKTIERCEKYKDHPILPMRVHNLLKYIYHGEIQDVMHKTFFTYLKLSARKKVLYAESCPQSKEVQELVTLLKDDDAIHAILDKYIDDCKYFLGNTVMVSSMDDVFAMQKEIDRVIFENGQGLAIGMQNTDVSEYYHTPSYTDSTNIRNIITNTKATCTKLTRFYVTRTYTTRHGQGEIYGEGDPTGFVKNLDLSMEANVENAYQGKFRYGRIHWDRMMQRIAQDKNPEILGGGLQVPCEHILAVTHTLETDHKLMLAPNIEKSLNDASLFSMDAIVEFPHACPIDNKDLIQKYNF